MTSRSASLPAPVPHYRDRKVDFEAKKKAAAGVTVYSFSFAYDTPGLVAGVEIGYTPEVGDVLLDAWFSITTDWDGSAFGDVGPFAGGSFAHLGLFAWNAGAVDMTSVDSDGNIFPPGQGIDSQDSGPTNSLAGTILDAYGFSIRYLPAKFTATAPIKVCVSAHGVGPGTPAGSTHGVDPGATQGEATVYVMAATPAS